MPRSSEQYSRESQLWEDAVPSEDTRERSIRQLRRGYMLGRISADTFERRVQCAMSTENTGEMAALLQGLPGGSFARAGKAIMDVLHSLTAPHHAPSLVSLSAKEKLCIGRSSGCDIHLTDTSVSRLHAELVLLDGRWNLRDTGSLNGTWVNGRRLRGQLEIRRGDILTFGEVSARF